MSQGGGISRFGTAAPNACQYMASAVVRFQAWKVMETSHELSIATYIQYY